MNSTLFFPLLLFVALSVDSFGLPQSDVQESALPTTCDDPTFDCVPFFQCRDGVIITDGRDLIDPRSKPPASCINKEYPDVTAVCCQIPGDTPPIKPVNGECVGISECVIPNLCGSDGTIKTDGAGVIDPRSNFPTCVLADKSAGVCCLPPKDIIDKCPLEASCIPASACIGKAIDVSGKPLDYNIKGSWTSCSANGESSNICCIPSGKSVVEEVKENCGIRNYDIDKRIQSDGLKNEAAFGEFPWQTIIFNQTYFFKCGASLISKKHVITAAHCVHGEKAPNILLRFGEWKVNSFDEKFPYSDRKAISILIHPEYDQKSKNFYNDIAIIEFDEPIVFQPHINTICLPNERTPGPAHGSICYASGWGKDAFQGKFQHVLKKIDLPYVDHKPCEVQMKETRLGKHFRLHKSFVCAGGQENKDACYGDGGGPLVCKTPAGYYDLIGITSWGIGCGTKDVPGVYVNVKQFSSWIDKALGTYKQSKLT